MERSQKGTLRVKSLKQGRAFFLPLVFLLLFCLCSTRLGGIGSLDSRLDARRLHHDDDDDDGAIVRAWRGEGRGGSRVREAPAASFLRPLSRRDCFTCCLRCIILPFILNFTHPRYPTYTHTQRSPMRTSSSWAVTGVVTLVAFLALSSQLLFSSISPGPLELDESVLFNTSLACLLVSYARSCLTNPGVVPDGCISAQAAWCVKCDRAKPARAHHCRTCKRCATTIPR